MISTKVLIYVFIIYFYSISYAVTETPIGKSDPTIDEPKGNCTCGGFPSILLQSDSVPLLSQTPGLIVKCDEEGASTCKSLCIALATAAKAHGPDIICNRLVAANELKLSAFYKTCDNPWLYADMTADAPLCCENSTSILCPSASTTNDTMEMEPKSLAH